MERRKFRRMLPLILAVGLLASGCLQIRFLRMTPDQLAIGDYGTVRVEQYKINQANGNGVTAPFLLIGFDEASLKLKQVSQFDMFSNFGGRFDRVNDTDLRDILLSGGDCAFNGVDAGNITGMKWWAYRTVGTVDLSTGGFGDIFRVKLTFERVGGANTSQGDFVVFSGSWLDLGDGIVQEGETACFSALFSSFAFFEL